MRRALVGAPGAIPIHWGTLYLPGFSGGRWGWGSSCRRCRRSPREAAGRAPALEVIVLSAAPAAPAKWTVMVYMSGDNNLEDYIVKDLELELAALGSTPNVQVTALADRGPGYDNSRGDWQTTKLFHPTQGMVADAAHQVADWGERNMGDPATLRDFVTWSKTNYPADHYALYFWGHGWGWHPTGRWRTTRPAATA